MVARCSRSRHSDGQNLGSAIIIVLLPRSYRLLGHKQPELSLRRQPRYQMPSRLNLPWFSCAFCVPSVLTPSLIQLGGGPFLYPDRSSATQTVLAFAEGLSDLPVTDGFFVFWLFRWLSIRKSKPYAGNTTKTVYTSTNRANKTLVRQKIMDLRTLVVDDSKVT